MCPTDPPPLAPQTDLVQLDRDHPGFRDPVYRRRRNEIAKVALGYHVGDSIPSITYTPEEVSVWQIALQKLVPLHAKYACDQYLRAFPLLGFEPGHVSQLGEVNEVLQRQTGFKMVPVAGLVSPRVFMSHLADDLFLATQYVRHHSAPLYTPEPDVIHELVGHAALLADSDFADVNRLFGEATNRVGEDKIDALIRVYWYTLEFGVVRSKQGLKVVGAGMLSSFGELGRFETQADIRPYDLPTIANTSFNPTDYQGILFVAPSVDWLLNDLRRWLRTFIP